MRLENLARRSLIQAEHDRLRERVAAKSARQVRSQYLGTLTAYDAEQGFAQISTTAGTINAQSITTSTLSRAAVSVPPGSTLGSADAKPRA